MDNSQIKKLGNALYEAMVSRNTLVPFTEQHPDITLEQAYEIQLQYIQRRLDAGEKIVGKKIGVTSKAVQDFLGVFQPDFGQLTDKMVYQEGETIDLNELIQPKAEAELAIVLKEDLIGPGITAVDVIRATDYVSPCFEIVDSRITDWKIKIQDTVADNASCGVYVVSNIKADKLFALFDKPGTQGVLHGITVFNGHFRVFISEFGNVVSAALSAFYPLTETDNLFLG